MSPIESLTLCLPLDGVPEPIDTAPSPEALAIQREIHGRLHVLFLNTFGAEEGAILTALYLDDLTARETAALFCCTERHIRHIRSKALKVLRGSAEIAALLHPTAAR